MPKNWVEHTKQLIERHGIDAQILEHKEWGKESQTVAKALGVPVTNIIKALLCFSNGKPLLAIILGDDRLDLAKLGALLHANVRLGRARELESLGFTVGGIPAVGSGLRSFVDARVLQREFVIGSAGSPYVGIRLKPSDLVKLNGSVVADLRSD
ncbi:MAG: YbaK/EbsC family protein [Candidatus Bathyarchaeia archaeon]